ncbi:unnamed protein product, partial [Rotaria magnacalcarata]
KCKGEDTLSKPSLLYFFSLLYSFLCMGLIQRTILKLSEQTNSTLDQLGYVFVTRPFSFLGGTIYAGIIVDHFVLFSRTFLTLKILIVSGIVNNLARILTLCHYGQHKVGSYMQAIHGAFGVGAFLSSLIVAPFFNKHRKFD